MLPHEFPSTWSRIAAYLLGDLEPSERLAFERQLATDAELRHDVAAAQQGLRTLGQPFDTVGLEDARDRAMNALASIPQVGADAPMFGWVDEQGVKKTSPARRARGSGSLRLGKGTLREDGSGSRSKRNPHLKLQQSWQWIAGCIVAGSVLLGVLMHQSISVPKTLTSSARTYTTATGQRAAFTLADGSHITLAPRSRLIIQSSFGNTNRTVALEGEAYFDVRSAAGVSFIVRTGTVATRVLGTSFTVRRYSGERTARIVVVSGRVVVDGRRSHATFGTDSLAFANDSVVSTTPITNVRQYTEWTRGRLVFNATPIAEMLATLGRWYGYEFRIQDSTLAKQVLTGEFRPDALDETLRLLQELLHVTAHYEGNVITLRARSGVPAPVHQHERELGSLSTEVGR